MLTTCARPEKVERLGTEPDIRVGVAVGVKDVRVSARSGFVAIADGQIVFRRSGGEGVRLIPDGHGVWVEGSAVSGRYETLSFVSSEPSVFMEVGSTPYRGVVEVFSSDGALTVVNQVPLEAYVAGVVSAELGRRSAEEMAAVEAQAVVSRTYALKNRGKFASEGFDLRATVSDQAYGGVAGETEQAWAGVRATAGLVLVYHGDLISPFFHSTCGAATAAVEESFRSAVPHPYLKTVSDRRSGGGYYCDISPRFRWTVEWDGAQLRDILRRTVPVVLGVDADMVDQVRDVRVRHTGPSGRVSELRIGVTRGEIPVFGPDVRAVLEEPNGRPLGSTAVELASNHRSDGQLQRLTAKGAGWGHGVGMCQWGAVGRARAGQDFRTIVTTYFPGADVKRWY